MRGNPHLQLPKVVAKMSISYLKQVSSALFALFALPALLMVVSVAVAVSDGSGADKTGVGCSEEVAGTGASTGVGTGASAGVGAGGCRV